MAVPSNIFFRAYQRIIHSLAFYPTLIAIGFFLLCLLTMAIEYQPWMMALKGHFDLGLVRNADNARLILGTLVAGILSLMVFSFSMVMVVLNNAAASLSPRVIPGLISSKGHQKTLGIYLGSILYALLLITTIEQGNSDRVPSLGVLIKNAANLITWADPEACEIAAGAWQSWGRDAVLPLHLIWVVPLVTPGHAEQHGAENWSREQKIAFLNDQDNLIILDPVSTAERADYSPEFWTPLERFWCEYATRWQRVKQRYQLTIGEAEGKALAHMLEQCASKS